MAKIKNDLISFSGNLNQKLNKTNRNIKLHINQDNLLLLSAIFSRQHSPKLIIIDKSPQICQLITDHLNKLSSLFSSSETWHHLSGQLTKQEINADIVSPLSISIHHLLNKTTEHHYVISAPLTNLPLPHRSTYQASLLVLHSGETYQLSLLTKQLVKLGYIRHTASSTEPGSFQINGEQIIIRPPTHHHPYKITLFGSIIEKIEYFDKQHVLLKNQIKLPPLRLSNLTNTLPNLTHHFTIFGPGYIASLFTKSFFLSFDAINPTLQFPSLNAPPYLQLITKPIKTPLSSRQAVPLIAKLTINKPAVHTDHGIGIYEGLQTRTINHITRDYLMLRYAAGDTLSVPVEYAYKVTAYLGHTTPTIHRLDSIIWRKTKAAAKAEAIKFAAELLSIAGRRRTTTRPPYHINNALAKQLDKSFPYRLTADQLKTWQEIQYDLTCSTPMDRLVVGDVGFGKTEIAIRLARHAADNGYQVALLAPTTLLVQQHYDTIINRLPDIHSAIGLLSRFTSTKEQADIYRQIKDNRLSIIVGTHALLSQQIKWFNLGLVIIDEEQRFGVAHKEHFKKLRANVDILSLSATPIPRTLSMSLSGLKQLSTISSPPIGRKSAITQVAPANDQLIKQAVERELARHGQIYVVAPRIRQLNAISYRLNKLVPHTRTAILHSQLSNQEIARIMRLFDNRQLDILISSTIIASGLDLPNANTIIVLYATHFGLADLYQLRGRIGRRQRQGYAYFLYNQTNLTNLQRRRLAALTEASRLGSGWSLAQRDLEIRGAGNLLGAKQSGTISSVGVQLYLDMVQNATTKQGHYLQRHDIQINLPLSTGIPTTYLPRLSQRTNLYQSLTRASSLTALTQIVQDTIGQYGPLPQPLTNLYYLLQIQHYAAQRNLASIDHRLITPPSQSPYYRITISAHQTNYDFSSLNLNQHWQIKNNTITTNIPRITPQLLLNIIALIKA